MTLAVSSIEFRPAPPLDVAVGLLGWASAELGDLRVSSIAVRRTRAGAYVLSFPTRCDRTGREHTLVQPITAEAHHAIEAQVLAELARRGVLS